MNDNNGNYSINKVGAYYIGHFNAMMFRIDFGDPETCISCTFRLNSDFMNKLIKTLGIDSEDGIWVSDAVAGKMVQLAFDDEGYIETISDIFGNNTFRVDHSQKAL